MSVTPFRPRKSGWQPTDSFVGPAKERVSLFPDRETPADWRVECEDDEGRCYVTIFAGPAVEHRARAYFAALKSGTLTLNGRPGD